MSLSVLLLVTNWGRLKNTCTGDYLLPGFSQPGARKLPLMRLREAAQGPRSEQMGGREGRQEPAQRSADTSSARRVGKDQGRWLRPCLEAQVLTSAAILCLSTGRMMSFGEFLECPVVTYSGERDWGLWGYVLAP